MQDENGQDLINETYVGTLLYASPVLYQNYKFCAHRQYSHYIKYNPFASDIYSLGIIILELMGVSRGNILNFKEEQVTLLLII